MPLPPARTRFLAAALLPILLATLWPFPGQEPEGFISCIACGAHATSDVLLNILLFAPLGAALALQPRSVTRCALTAALLSAAIELTQLYIPGRDSSLGDVLANTLGGTLGALLTRIAVLWLLPAPARAARLSRTAAFAAAAVCRATGARFDQPDIRLVSAMRHVGAGDTLDITVTRGGARQEGDYRIALNGRMTSGLGCAVGCGWALLIYPEVFPAWLRLLLGAAWVGGLFAPAGFWMRTRSDALFAAAAVATGLAGAPVFTPLVATPALQWLAAALGVAAGAGVRIAL